MKTIHIYLVSVALTAGLLGSVPAHAQSLKIGGSDGLVSIDTGSGGSGGSSGGGLSVGVGRNGSAVDVQSGGGGLSDHPTISAGVGDSDAAIVDLFGGGENGAATVEADLGAGDPETSDVRATLFGNGGSAEDVAVVVDLFGPGAGGGPGGGGSDGADDTPTGSVGGGSQSSGATFLAASGKDRCFTPDRQQIAHLVNRSGATRSLSGVNAVRIVPIRLCPSVRPDVAAALAGNSRVEALRAKIAGRDQLVAALGPKYGPADVLAAAKSNGTLTLYVF